MSRHALAALALVLPLLLAGCNDECAGDADCPAGSRCEGGVCVLMVASGGTGGVDAGGSGGGGSGGIDEPGGSGGIGEGGSGGGAGGGCAADRDDDGVCDEDDNCPDLRNPSQVDGDGDHLGDLCDECPEDPLNDADDDGTCAGDDLCPEVFDDGTDTDGDGKGDACDDDDDGDGSLDVDDCRPLDAAVHPGAPDPCDGADTDCRDLACTFGSDALGDVRPAALACHTGRPLCVVAGAAEDPRGGGALLSFDFGAAVPALELGVSVGALRGVAVDVARSEPVFWVTEDDAVRAYRGGGDGALLATVHTGGVVLPGPIALTPDGAVAMVPAENSRLFQLDAASVLAGPPYEFTCGLDVRCVPFDLQYLQGPVLPLGIRQPVAVAARPAAGKIWAYLSFSDDTEVAAAALHAGAILAGSGLLAPNLPAPAKLVLGSAGPRLHVAGANRAAATYALGPTVDDHGLSSWLLPAGTCPAAVAEVNGTLLFAGDCGDGPGHLVTVPLDGGGAPDAAAAETRALEGCAPVAIAAVPAPVPGGGASRVVVACAGSGDLLLLGAD